MQDVLSEDHGGASSGLNGQLFLCPWEEGHGPSMRPGDIMEINLY
eukprot:CAMPEP_0170573132 /NCGR_PEP_ID=MMETSP0224-20130122/2599_1 /TAXON_ID=285029 /ORGANISM="Togula jolla, Strain CCCM 725" /LENGTH=44 /DNA_ID= /DNA_START= /DNA_END= /DNA_ORIENTATION=